MSIRDKMRPLFRTLDGGLFSEKSGKGRRGRCGVQAPSGGRHPDVLGGPFLSRPGDPTEGTGAQCGGHPAGGGLPLYPAHRQCGPERGHCEKKSSRDNHIKVNPQRNIIINPGSDVGLYFAMTPFIEPGDEVLVHDPSYPSNFLDPPAAQRRGGEGAHL